MRFDGRLTVPLTLLSLLLVACQATLTPNPGSTGL